MASPAPPIANAIKELTESLDALEAMLDEKMAAHAKQDDTLETIQRQAKIASAQAHFAAQELANTIQVLKVMIAQSQKTAQTDGPTTAAASSPKDDGPDDGPEDKPDETLG